MSNTNVFRSLQFLIFSLVLTCSSAQDFPVNTEIFGHFIIKDHWVISQKYADSMAAREALFFENLKNDPNPPPSPPGVAVLDLKSNIHFIIESDRFIHYTIPNEFVEDTLVTKGVSKIVKVNRKTLKIDSFSPNSFSLWENFNALYYKDSNYEILEENQSKRKFILGYDCFQVLLEDHVGYLIELYVTDAIKLEFHPVINAKMILSKYYPLYIRRYDPEFPSENYREYEFYKYF